jgi:hypothetical protein
MLLPLIQVIAVMMVALVAASTLAHALELPGKMRLDRQTYFAVQKIYYPGFTIAGIGEPLSVILTAALLFFVGPKAFWLVLIALLGLLAMHAVYWVFIHPVNKYWTEGQAMGALGAGFFDLGTRDKGRSPEWTELRDRWEYAHAARAALNSISLLALVVSLIVRA